ncbi:MAG: molybdopterin molybdotransferase MoeA [Lachnospiraceae bacterium]|nr:molybdopterin molybdotransferase MoeA [Lachnospiraceae bacterium]
MLQMEEAIEILQEQVTAIRETEQIPLLEAVGRILAQEGRAGLDQPPFPRSPLDGYAVRGQDTEGAGKENPKLLQVIGKIYAGEAFSGRVGENQAVRLMTGAPIPDGADTVIRQENSDYGEDQVQIYQSSKPYQNYCYQGEDYQAGAVLLKQGQVMDGAAVSVAASMGLQEVSVYRKPRIAVISTGDELTEPGIPLKAGKIYDSNLYLICGRLAELGATPVYSCHWDDEPEGLAEEIRKLAGKTDLIVTTGGVSVGEKDIMHEVIRLLAARQLFWRVNVKPGAPTLAAVYEGTLIICLSGNPFAAAANFELLVRPVMGKLTGDKRWMVKKIRARLETDYSKPKGSRRFLRGYAEDGKVWLAAGNHASGALSSLVGSNCLVEILPDQAGARKEEEVWVYLL